MRKGFIIDLQSGLNWNNDYSFLDIGNFDGPSHVLMPGSASFPYERKVRIGDMWRLNYAATSSALLLSVTNDKINVSNGDYFIAIQTGSDGYVSRTIASHWEIHKANPSASDGIIYDAEHNNYSLQLKPNYGLVVDLNGASVSGSNMNVKSQIKSEDWMVMLTGSNQQPHKIKYSEILLGINAAVGSKFASQYRVLTYVLKPADELHWISTKTLPITFNFDNEIDFAPNTDFHAHIGNLFLKASGGIHYAPGVETPPEQFEIKKSKVGESGIKFTLLNLKFKPEAGDLFQAFCFLSGSSINVASVTGPADNTDD